MVLRATAIVLNCLVFYLSAVSQTCCSGGVPVSANLGMPMAEARSIQLNLSYDLNVLNTLKSGSEKLEDDTRRRTTHSFLIELGYSITDRWSIDLLLSAVRQERRISNSFGEDITSTSGLGDATILTKYNLLNSERMNLTPGLGVKLPTGRSDLVRNDGIALSADLQPGSGALDMIYWINYTLNGLLSPSGTLFLTAVYSRKGINQDYLGSQAYQFGDEWQVSAGASIQTLIQSWIAIPAMTLRYRHATSDVIDAQILPSTGGEWVFANPSIAVAPNPKTSWTLSADLPVMARVDGTQVTPTYRLNFAFFHKLSFTKNKPRKT